VNVLVRADRRPRPRPAGYARSSTERPPLRERRSIVYFERCLALARAIADGTAAEFVELDIRIDAELARARALVDKLWNSNDPTGVARLQAHTRG